MTTRPNIQVTALEVWTWAEATFPKRTDQSMFLKLYSELGELADSGGDRLEFADVMILLLDYAVRKNIDIHKAISEKLEINRARQWEVNSVGVMSHVKEQ